MRFETHLRLWIARARVVGLMLLFAVAACNGSDSTDDPLYFAELPISVGGWADQSRLPCSSTR